MSLGNMIKYLLFWFIVPITSCNISNENNIYTHSRLIEVNLEGDSRDQLEEYLSKLHIYDSEERLYS